FADIVRFRHDLPGQRLLNADAPCLLVRDIAADCWYGSQSAKAYIVQWSQILRAIRLAAGNPRRQLRPSRAGAYCRERIAQPRTRQHSSGESSNALECSEPWSLLVETLISPRTCSRCSGTRLREINSVSATKHRAVGHFPGKTKTRLPCTVVSVVVVAL